MTRWLGWESSAGGAKESSPEWSVAELRERIHYPGKGGGDSRQWNSEAAALQLR